MIKKHNKTIKEFDSDTEIMKIFASFFVVMIHSSGIDSLSAVIFSSISRFSVPVFVIISGYYMLMRKPSGRHLVIKCSKLFGLMLIWSGIYYSYNLFCGRCEFTGMRGMLRYLLTEPIHLWYIYAAITLYLFTPLLYVFHNNATKKEYLYALALTFFFGSLIIILLRSNLIPVLSIIVEKMKVPYTLGFVCLYMFGGYLRKYGIISEKYRYLLYLFALCSIAVTIIGTMVLPAYGIANDLLLSFFAPNSLIYGAAFFVFIQQVFRSLQIKSSKVRICIHNIADCTMGIYFLHPLILMMLQATVEQYYFSDKLYILILHRALLANLVSLVIVFIAKKIPVLKHLF